MTVFLQHFHQGRGMLNLFRTCSTVEWQGPNVFFFLRSRVLRSTFYVREWTARIFVRSSLICLMGNVCNFMVPRLKIMGSGKKFQISLRSWQFISFSTSWNGLAYYNIYNMLMVRWNIWFFWCVWSINDNGFQITYHKLEVGKLLIF